MHRNVAVIVETSNDYARGILRGIHDYQLTKPEWNIYLAEHRRHEPVDTYVGDWDCHGVIARVETDDMASVIGRMSVPVVDAGSDRLIPNIPWVVAHDGEIVRLAVEHLSDCGLRHVGFFGDRYYNWSQWRRESLLRHARRLELPSYVYELPDRADRKVWWNSRRESITHWIQSLPKPVGVFACSDYYAQRLLEICRDSGIVVPHDVAVMGTDNDELLCELSNPPLTSVIPNTRATGIRAARLLDAMMNGEPVKAIRHSVPPIGIEKRGSTDILAVHDAHVSRAVGFIRERATENVTADDVSRHVGLSRRALESRFRAALNCTPHQEISRVRIHRIRELLSRTDKTLSEVAEIMNIPHVEYLSVFFKRHTGQTPSEYRNETRYPGR